MRTVCWWRPSISSDQSAPGYFSDVYADVQNSTLGTVIKQLLEVRGTIQKDRVTPKVPCDGIPCSKWRLRRLMEEAKNLQWGECPRGTRLFYQNPTKEHISSPPCTSRCTEEQHRARTEAKQHFIEQQYLCEQWLSLPPLLSAAEVCREVVQLPPATAAVFLCTAPHVIINNITELILCRSKITANSQQKYNCSKPWANSSFCAFCDATLRFFPPPVANIEPNTVITAKLRPVLLEVLRSFLTLHYLPLSSDQKICINVTWFLKPLEVTH